METGEFRDAVASSDAVFVDSAAISNVTNTNNTHRIDRPSLPPIITGTNTTSASIPTVSQTPRTDYLWLHLSRLAASVTIEQVVSLVCLQLDTADAIAFSLLKAGTVPSPLSAVSFKVRIPAALRSKALNAASWPVGLGVREFISLPPRSLHSRTQHTNTYTPIPQQPRTQQTPAPLQPRTQHSPAPQQPCTQHNNPHNNPYSPAHIHEPARTQTEQSPTDMNCTLPSPTLPSTSRSKTLQTTLVQFFPK